MQSIGLHHEDNFGSIMTLSKESTASLLYSSEIYSNSIWFVLRPLSSVYLLRDQTPSICDPSIHRRGNRWEVGCDWRNHVFGVICVNLLPFHVMLSTHARRAIFVKISSMIWPWFLSSWRNVGIIPFLDVVWWREILGVCFSHRSSYKGANSKVLFVISAPILFQKDVPVSYRKLKIFGHVR